MMMLVVQEDSKNMAMSGRGIKQKGKRGESELAKILEEVWKAPFLRVPNSGAYVGGQNIARRERLSENQARVFSGDIIVPEDFGDFVIECKFHRDLPYHKILKGEETILNKWIEQVESYGPGAWLLAFKTNRKGWYFLSESSIVEHCEIKRYSIVRFENGNRYAIFSLEELRNITSEQIKNYIKSKSDSA